MSWSLSDPSTIQFKMPDWRGDYNLVAGAAENAASVLYNAGHAVIDPVGKAATATEDAALNALGGAYDLSTSAVSKAGSFIASPFVSAWEGVKSGTAAILNPLGSGLKWGLAIVVVGIALYTLAIVSPFIPKPRGS